MTAHARIGLAALLTLLATASARAQPVDICDALGLPGKFTVATPGKFQSRPFGLRYSSSSVAYGTITIGSICAKKGQIAQTWIDGDFMSPLTKGSAFAFKRLPPYAGDDNIVNHVITGGALVSGAQYGFYDAFDVYGNNPWAGWCQEAVDTMPGISAAIAARTPTLSLGSVSVKIGETHTIDLGSAGSAIVNLDDLILQSSKASGRDPDCGSIDEELTARLVIDADPGAHVVLNIAGTLALGQCHAVEFDGERLLYNLPDRGRKVVIAINSVESIPFPFLLAPERNVSVGSFYRDTLYWGNILAKNVKIQGSTWIYADCYSLPDPGNGLVEAGYNEQCDPPDDSACPGACNGYTCGFVESDACEDAIEITALPFTHTQNTATATNAAEAPMCSLARRTAWYRYTAPVSGTLRVETVDNRYDDTTLAAYTGACGALTSVDCNDDRSSKDLQSQLKLPVTAGETYWFQVDPGDLDVVRLRVTQ